MYYMHGLLAPAILLMNSLSYAKKFGVISITFFIPLLVLSFVIVNKTYQDIEKTKQAQASLQIINDVIDVVDKASLYRELASAEVFSSNRELDDATIVAEGVLYKSLNKLVAKHRTSAVAKEIISKLKQWRVRFGRNGGNLQPTIKDQYKSYGVGVNEILFLAMKSSQLSGIAQDTDPNVQVLLKLILADYPSYRDQLGLTHSLSISALGVKFISASSYDNLNNAYDSMDLISKEMKQRHASLLKSSPIFSESFPDTFKKIEKNIDDIKIKFDEEIVSAMNLEISWTQFSEFYKGKTKDFSLVRKIAIPELNNILQIRIDHLTQKLLTVVVAIALVMLLIIYLYAAFFWSVRSTVGEFHDAAQKISKGDMRVRVKNQSKDEMGELTSEFNVMVENIHSLLQAVHKNAADVGLAMDQVGTNAEHSNRAANEQQKQTQQVAEAISNMSATASGVNRQSEEAAESATKATNQASSANKVVDETLTKISSLADEIMRSTDVINQLSENSTNVGNMLAVIKGIAEQTNLLALNAAIEAARAGEQGRGFAVVADEVRTLASRTQSSAQEIEEVMSSLHSGIANAVDVMGNSHKMAQDTVKSSGEVRTALDAIVEMVAEIATINNQISASSGQQTQVAKTIDDNVAKINESGRATVDGAQHTVKAIKEVAALTESLREKLERFQV
jgi:methyl-accepting chemotaxis protein